MQENGSSEAAPGKLAGLKFYKHVHTEDGEMAEFFTRLDPLFALWKRGQTTAMYISQILANLPPQALVGGHILLWPALGAASRVPLFMRPQVEFLMGFGILPAVPQAFVNDVLPRLYLASQASSVLGGKRYLSGWINFDHAAWKAHYGEQWPMVAAAKQRFDPEGVLNPGFVKYF
jgi:hypothetical protein